MAFSVLLMVISISTFIISWRQSKTYGNGISSYELDANLFEQSSELNGTCYDSLGNKFTNEQLLPNFHRRRNKRDIFKPLMDESKLTNRSTRRKTSDLSISEADDDTLPNQNISDPSILPVNFLDSFFSKFIKPSCSGLWIGLTIDDQHYLTNIAEWKKNICGSDNDIVYGFITNVILPDDTVHQSLDISDPDNQMAPSNLIIYRDISTDALPIHLLPMDKLSKCHTPISLFHIHCETCSDLQNTLFIVSNRLVQGSVIVLSKVFKLPPYRMDEIKNLYEFTQNTKIKLDPITSGIDIRPEVKSAPYSQAVAFVVAQQDKPTEVTE